MYGRPSCTRHLGSAAEHPVLLIVLTLADVVAARRRLRIDAAVIMAAR